MMETRDGGAVIAVGLTAGVEMARELGQELGPAVASEAARGMIEAMTIALAEWTSPDAAIAVLAETAAALESVAANRRRREGN